MRHKLLPSCGIGLQASSILKLERRSPSADLRTSLLSGTSSQSSYAFWPDNEAAQRIGHSELQAAGLEPCPVADFVTASHLSLSRTSKLRYRSSRFL
jgi:hypothetical protein